MWKQQQRAITFTTFTTFVKRVASDNDNDHDREKPFGLYVFSVAFLIEINIFLLFFLIQCYTYT